MDIHRCRFLPYPVSPINAVAFSHPTWRVRKRDKRFPVRLAIGRANGDLELWNPADGAWHQESRICGGNDRSIDGLVWLCGEDEDVGDGKVILGRMRLFSFGGNSSVTEWDLEKGRVKRQAAGQLSDIWCLAAQPLDRKTNETGTQAQKLVAGTVDGSLLLYATEDDELRLQRTLVKSSKKVAMVCLAFQTRHVAIVGCADGTLRAYDIRNGSLIRKMTIGSDLSGGSKDVIVWTVRCLPNGDIVSGDSTGQICIWDGKTHTQMQRIKSHEQDVLSLALSDDGSTIISGGLDRRTTFYTRPSGPGSRWAKAYHRRYHNHDVKTLSAFEGKGLSVVVSGGSDGRPIVIPLMKAGLENHRTLSHLPQDVPMLSAPQARLIVSWWNQEVQVWKLYQPAQNLLEAPEDDQTELRKNRKLLAQIRIKGDASIASASISSDGSFLAVATATSVIAFALKIQQFEAQVESLRVTKLKNIPPEWGHGASKVLVSPNGRWVCAVHEGTRITVTRMESEENNISTKATQRLKRLRRDTTKYSLLGGLGAYDRSITQLAFSADSSVLAAADLAGYIDSWRLSDTVNGLANGTHAEESAASEPSSDSSSDSEDEAKGVHAGPYWKLTTVSAPKLPGAPIVLSFSNDTSSPHSIGELVGEHVLLAITNTRRLILLHPLRGRLTDWTKRNDHARMPAEFLDLRDLPRGVIWQGARLWVYGTSSVFMFDTSRDIEDVATSSEVKEKKPKERKRKRGDDTGAGNRMAKTALAIDQVRKSQNNAAPADAWVDVEMADAGGQRQSDSEDDDDEAMVDAGELQQLRHGEASSSGEQGTPKAGRSFVCVHKYRSILGVVPLEHKDATSVGNSKDRPLEVALVERPIWDVELPAQLLGTERR